MTIRVACVCAHLQSRPSVVTWLAYETVSITTLPCGARAMADAVPHSDSTTGARVVCLVTPDRVRPGHLSFVWSQGPDAFPPVTFDPQLVDMLQDAIREVRERLEQLVRIYVDALVTAEKEGHSDVRTASLELARAGYDLRTRLFAPTQESDHVAQAVAGWLASLHARGEVESLEVVADDLVPEIPWNLVYETDPDEQAFLAGADGGEQWQSFWGLRYNLAGGQRVDPRRRSALPSAPQVLLVIDEWVLEGLRRHPDSEVQAKAAALEGMKARPGVDWVSSRGELQKRLRAGRPDILYWLGHTADESGWLVLGDDEVKPADLRAWLDADRVRPPGGVVFLNACRTAGTTRGGGSFLDSVLKTRMGGVIATEHVVLDTFANPLGLDFLEAFLAGDRSVGMILRDLRGRVPLGLLYGTYCPPELRVRRPEAVPPVAEPIPISTDAPQPGRSLGIASPAERGPELPDRPYPSLNYYDRGDRALFAGRDDDVIRFAHILDDDATRVLVLHGESGAGKSSFLRAGVVPYLEDVCVGYRFTTDRGEVGPAAGDGAAGRPRFDPVLFVRATDDLPGQLADALATFAGKPLAVRRPSGEADWIDLPAGLAGETGGRTDAEGIQAAIEADPGCLGRLLAALAARLPFRLVLVIDQAEEVFTLGDAHDRERPGRALALLREAAATAGEFRVIVSLRTEYYGRLIDHLRSGVRAAVGVRDYLLTELTEAALAEAIRRPTEGRAFARYGFRYDDGFAETLSRNLVAHTTGRQDSVLPLAQVICGQLYDRVKDRPDRVIRADDLTAIGGVVGGMKRHADGLVKKLLPEPRDRQAFRRLASGLYRPQPDGTLTTDLVPEQVLAGRWSGRAPFAEMLGRASGGEWRLLRVTQRRVGSEVRTDVSLGHDALAKVAADWDAEATRWRRARKLLTAVAGVSVLALTFAWLGLVALVKSGEAEEQTVIAEEQASKAKKAEGDAIKQKDEAVKAKERVELDRYYSTMRVADLLWQAGKQAESAGLLAIYFTPERVPKSARVQGRHGFEWNYQWRRTMLVSPPLDHGGAGVRSVAWSPDGTRLATGADDGKARVWDVATGKDTALDHGGAAVHSVAWSPDGTRLATRAGDGKARVWDVATGKDTALDHGGAFVWSVAWSPDGTRLATGAGDGKARVWDVATGKDTALDHGKAFVGSVAWSPDGTRLATWADDGKARVWDVAAGKDTALDHGGAGVWSVAWSPDGTRLATGTGESNRVYETRDFHLLLMTEHRQGPAFLYLAWSSDGRHLATSDGTQVVIFNGSPIPATRPNPHGQ